MQVGHFLKVFVMEYRSLSELVLKPLGYVCLAINIGYIYKLAYFSSFVENIGTIVCNMTDSKVVACNQLI